VKTGRLKQKAGRATECPATSEGFGGDAIGSNPVAWYSLAGVVALITLVIYLPTLRNDFVSLDDYGYVLDNLHIRSLGPAFFQWAFTDLSAGFWHPVTWISYAVDYAIWGLNPLGYHFSAILIHALNTFLVCRLSAGLLYAARQAGSCPVCLDKQRILIAAGATALLFGLHPLHVESVAWISERKDLVCAFFFLLSLIAYLRYSATSGSKISGETSSKFYLNRHYLLSLAFFILALAGKTMAVSLPIVLLILDWYPLERIRSRNHFTLALLEKIPFISASLIISITSIIAQKSIGAMALMDSKPLATRLLVAFKALTVYLWKMVLPLHLIPYYPYPRSVSLLTPEHGLPILVFAGITAAAILLARKEPAWLAAWGIYLVILLPTLGIVQVGVHSMGDRFTYLPSLAPFLLAGVGAARIWTPPTSQGHSACVPKQIATVVAITLVCALIYATLKQISVWNNSMVLWNYVIERGGEFNPLAYNSRGHVYRDRGEFDKAISDYSVAMTQEPAQAEYLVSRGVAFCEKGDLERAMTDLNRAIALSPKEYLAYNNRGSVWYRKGENERAIEDFTRAIALKPSEHLAYRNRGVVYEKKGALDNAISDYSAVLTINPLLAGAYIDRGDLYMKKGAMELAAGDYLKAGNLGDMRRMPGAGERRFP